MSDTPKRDRAKDARNRIDTITELFGQIELLVRRWLDQEEPVTLASTKKVLGKMSELQSAHVLVLRAEEAFHEKFGTEEARTDSFDSEAARRDIGRKLDRIRAFLEAGGVPQEPDD